MPVGISFQDASKAQLKPANSEHWCRLQKLRETLQNAVPIAIRKNPTILQILVGTTFCMVFAWFRNVTSFWQGDQNQSQNNSTCNRRPFSNG